MVWGLFPGVYKKCFMGVAYAGIPFQVLYWRSGTGIRVRNDPFTSGWMKKRKQGRRKGDLWRTGRGEWGIGDEESEILH